MLALWNKLKLVRRRESPPSAINTDRAIRPTYEGEAYRLPELKLEAAWLSDAGCVRERNEDNAIYVQPSDASTLETKGCLMVVADGVGGHSAGETASRLAVEIISRNYFENAAEAESENDEGISSDLREAFRLANRTIYQMAQNNLRLQSMGTTCTALVLRGAQAYAAQIGDSRLYLVRDDRIYQLSEDHSAVMEMVRQGMMTIAEASLHEDRNIILRALGTQPEVEISVWEKPLPVRVGDCFLLCTDGLFDPVSDEEIREIVTGSTAIEACRQLVDLAKAKGGYDNITVGIVKVMS